jgi:orotate phosphoribosyltransferase
MFSISETTSDFGALKTQLLKIIKDTSYREGDFVLASGRKSKFYLDLKETTLNQEGMSLAAALMVNILINQKLNAFAVGGLTMGADPIASAVSLAAAVRGLKLQSFIVRKQAKEHGTLAWIEGAKSFPKGAHLVVLEDVVTTGGSSLKAVERLREAGFIVNTVITIVDRQEGGAQALAAAGLQLISLCSLEELLTKSAG